MQKMEWAEELPTVNTRRGSSAHYADFAKALRKRPGKWAKYPRREGQCSPATAITANINRGSIATLPAGEFEARTVLGDTWVRCVA